MTVQLAPAPVFQAFAPNGQFLVGGQLFTYVAGTSTPQATYVDSTQTTPNTNPVILNAMGEANVWLVVGETYKLVLKDSAGNLLWTVDNISGGSALTFQIIGSILYPTLPHEVGVVNNGYAYGVPERFGAVGDGVTPDQAAMTNWAASGDALTLSADKSYLITGLVISTPGKKISGPTGGENTSLLISAALGSFGLQFVSPGQAGAVGSHLSAPAVTHFGSSFVGRDFAIKTQASVNQTYGIWCNNAEVAYLDGVVIDLSGNTFTGVANNATYAFVGYFQQDGVFSKVTCVGAGLAFADGIFLTGNHAANQTPNNNLFVGCRVENCSGYGFRNSLADGTMWLGDKLEANSLGGWIEADDGHGNGPSNTLIFGAGIESNSGNNIQIDVSNHPIIRNCVFQSTASTNSINATFVTNALFEGNFCFTAHPVNFLSGSGNRWDQNNTGFGTVTAAAGVLTWRNVVADAQAATINTDAATGDYFTVNITTAVAVAFATPTNPSNGQIITYQVANNSGGAMGAVTFSAGFSLVGGAASFVTPATAHSRTITFRFNSAAWIEVARNAADI